MRSQTVTYRQFHHYTQQLSEVSFNYCLNFFFFILRFLVWGCGGVVCPSRRLLLGHHSYSVRLASMSCCTTSLNLSFGLPLSLYPSTSISHPLLTGSSLSMRSTCPYPFSLISLKISLIFSTPTLHLISSFITPSV